MARPIPLKAVILAGGFGTRLRPLTLTCPKPLLPVANVPIVRRIVDKLPKDVDEVVLAVNYRLEQLQRYFSEHDVGRKVTLVEEKEPLGTAGALKNVERHVRDGPFFVFNGDVLDSLDLVAFRRFHEAKGGLGALALWTVSDPRHFGVMQMDGDRIVRFVEKPATKEEAPSHLANAGTYLLEPEVFDLVPAGQPVSIERETFPKALDLGHRLHGFPFEGFWVDCGRPETYLRANEAVLRAARRHVLLGERTVNRGAAFDDWAVVGAGCTLGTDVSIARSVLLSGVRVGNNVTIKDSIVGPNVHIEDDAALMECVVGEGARVEKGVLLKNVKTDPPSS
ncbi:MAG TPA: NDP-sugar synthase [Candidatus Thermoplasmatota archaeon]|nr:NDP-sugar synthase [Candidatus Thermoplasmatota archaeon]